MEQSSYSQRILDIAPPDHLSAFTEDGRQVYRMACHNTKYSAAEIAKEADARIADLLQACRRAQSVLRTAEGDIEDATGKRVVNRTIELLTRATEGLPVEEDMTIIAKSFGIDDFPLASTLCP